MQGWQIVALPQDDETARRVNYSAMVVESLTQANMTKNDLTDRLIDYYAKKRYPREHGVSMMSQIYAALFESNVSLTQFMIITEAMGWQLTYTIHVKRRPDSKPYPEIWDEELRRLGISDLTIKKLRQGGIECAADLIQHDETHLAVKFNLNRLAMSNLKRVLKHRNLYFGTNTIERATYLEQQKEKQHAPQT